MARQKTPNLPDLAALLAPRDRMTLAIEQAVLRTQHGAEAAMPIAEQIAARLAGMITLDQIHAGQRLLEKEVSEVLKVSRAPVREAFRILERDRLVEIQPRRGAFVTAPDEGDLKDIFAVRTSLFGILLAQAMREAPGALERTFAEGIKRLERAARESHDAYALENFLLNDAVFDLCSNRLLADMLKSISLRTLRYVRLAITLPGRIEESLRTARALHRAIQRGDAAAVVRFAEERMTASRDAAVRALARSRSGAGRAARTRTGAAARSRGAIAPA